MSLEREKLQDLKSTDSKEFKATDAPLDPYTGVEITKEIDTAPKPPAVVAPGFVASVKEHFFISFLCLLIAFGGVVFGYDTGTIPGFVNMSDFLERFGQDSANGPYLSNVRVGLMISIFHIGCAIGGIFVCKVADVYGRRIGLIVSMAIYVVGVVVQMTSTTHWYQYFIGRFITGLAVGTLFVVAPMMISETSPKSVRGALVCCFQLMVTLGMVIGYCTTYGTRKLAGSKQWRVPLGIGFVWVAIVVSAMIFMPESPRFLVEKGKIMAAKRSVAKANNTAVDDPAVDAEILLIQTGLEDGANESASWTELFKGQPRIFERVLMGVMLQALQQLTGVNYFFYYGTTIFNAVGLGDAFLTSIILGLVNFASTFVGVYAIDRFGRRPSLLVGSVAMLTAFVVYAVLGSVNLYNTDSTSGPTDKPTGNAMIFLSCFFIFFFASTWAGGCLCIISETYPLKIRAKGMSVATAANWFTNFLITFFTPFITAKINFYYGFVFSGCILFSFFYVYFVVPETKGLTLEEVDELYRQNIKPWKSASWVPPTREVAKEVLPIQI